MEKISINKCPNCGADLKFNEEGIARCEYCGTEFENEHHVKKKAYDEESGKLKAQREHQQKMYEQQKLQEEEQRRLEKQRELEEKRKNRGCLWWCGMGFLWLCFFPIMFTIYIVKNDKLDTKKKVIILVVAWAVFLFLGLTQNEKDTSENSGSNYGSSALVDDGERKTDEQAEAAPGNQTAELSETREQAQDKVKEESATQTPATEASGTETAEESSQDGKSDIPLGKQNALAMALAHLETLAFSKKSLKEQLVYEGFSEEEAEYGVDQCEADWKEQAAKKAREYNNLMAMPAEQLREQLAYEGFTEEEIEYAIKESGY